MGTSGPKVADTDRDRLTDRARRASHIFLRAAHSPHLVCLNLRFLLFYGADRWQDRRWRIKSGVGFRGYRSVAQLEVVGDRRSASPYVPTPYGTLRRLFAALPFDVSGYSFVDFGSGKGRALVVAARHGFKQVVGVEFTLALHEAAVQNIAAAGADGCARSVLCDAREFCIPNGPCVLFFFNPFGAEVMSRVAANVAAAFRDNPREIIVGFYNNTVGGRIFETLGLFRPLATVNEGWLASLSHSGRYQITLLRASAHDAN